MVLLNCGATEDVRSLCDLPTNIRIVIIDHHRPIWHGHNDPQVVGITGLGWRAVHASPNQRSAPCSFTIVGQRIRHVCDPLSALIILKRLRFLHRTTTPWCFWTRTTQSRCSRSPSRTMSWTRKVREVILGAADTTAAAVLPSRPFVWE